MFKINDKVKLKEVHKNYCRGEIRRINALTNNWNSSINR